MDKILFLNEKDRNTGLSLEHSDYRYKTAKPVAATKPKHDEVGFTIPYAMFRPIREPGLLCELLGDNPVRRTADLKMNFDFLVKDLYENEISRLMLSNETYVGDKLLQKKPPVDYITKKPDPNREYKPNYLTDDHEAIIDRKTWDAVQEILKQREADNKAGIYRRSKEHHPLYGKVFCGECGAPFVRRTYKGRHGHYKAWNCKERQKGKKGNGCMNVIVKEDALVQAVSEKMGADAVDRVQKVLVYKDRIEIV